jgi:hypothetical protein
MGLIPLAPIPRKATSSLCHGRFPGLDNRPKIRRFRPNFRWALWPGDFSAARNPARQAVSRNQTMAKAVSLKIKLVSTADTGYYYVTKKNSRTQTEKLSFK